MISILIWNSVKKELYDMEIYAHYLAGRLSEEEWSYYTCSSDYEIQRFFKKNNSIDIACIDLAFPDAIKKAERIRRLNPHAYIILVATMDILPTEYLKPEIMAASLLLRSYTEKQMRKVFESAFRNYLKKFENDDDKEGVYVIDTRDGRQLIPYNQILYFEAREKKIVVRTENSEIFCYDTIIDLEKNLPVNFFRCHRSYIINKNKITKLQLTKNIVILDGQIKIPVSRSYKALFKESVYLIPVLES